MPTLICVDASFLVRLLREDSQGSGDLWKGWIQAGRGIVAPALLFYEVTNALHRYVVQKVLKHEEARELIDTALHLGIRLHAESDLHLRALVFADRYKLAATYDAHYLALAVMLEADFWTADSRLVNSSGPVLPGYIW